MTNHGIIMIEAGADIVSEDRIAEALEFGIKALQPLLKLQEQMKKEVGKPDIDPKLDLVPKEVVKQVRALMTDAQREKLPKRPRGAMPFEIPAPAEVEKP